MNAQSPDSQNNKIRFTPLIKQLQDNQGNCLCPEKTFNDLFELVGQTLRSNMWKRGLWNAPLSRLGYQGEKTWKETIFIETVNSGVWYEIVWDCYDEICRCVPKYCNQMKVVENIDDWVNRDIQNFLTERQRGYDPEYKIFKRVQSAVQCAIGMGVLTPSQLGKLGKIENKTLLTFSSFSSSDGSTLSEQSLISKALRHSPEWTKLRHFPEWTKFRQDLTERIEKIQGPLCEIICQLPKYGIKCFLLRDLENAIKKDIFELNPIFESIGDIIDEPVQPPDTIYIYESFQNWRKWCDTIKQAIDNLDNKQKRVRTQLRKTVVKLDNIIEDLQNVFEELENNTEAEKGIPSQAELARLLGIPPATFNGYIKILKELYMQIKAESKDLEPCQLMDEMFEQLTKVR